MPMVCAEKAPDVELLMPITTDNVCQTIRTNASSLARSLRIAASVGTDSRRLTWQEFDGGSYNPTPTIVDAARAIYAGHSVAEIGRTDAEGINLQRTAERLRHWALEARQRGEHVICLVEGSPGAGKSLLGLNLVLAEGAGRVAGEPAVMLTGNRPLIHVLKGALKTDAKSRGRSDGVERALDGALQTLLGYLRTHADEHGAPPPEKVVVYDEAQRAWDAETGLKLLQRRRSEPELFLEVLSRLPWACLVCLVGSGQEINRGEGGMKLWESAIALEAGAGHSWRIVAAAPLQQSLPVEIDPAMRLESGLRAYRNTQYTQWVDAVLSGEIGRAAVLAAAMAYPPAFVTRNLGDLKEWLLLRRRGGRRPGLLASSGAVRGIADGIPPSPLSNELKKIENWFLKVWPDFRGSDSLETPLSEFGCQGLELDYVGLCWGGDLVWSPQRSAWSHRRMNAPRWVAIRRADKAQYRLNAYRVLLTRAREGMCVYVPRGNSHDDTHQSSDFDAVASVLLRAGCALVPANINQSSGKNNDSEIQVGGCEGEHVG